MPGTIRPLRWRTRLASTHNALASAAFQVESRTASCTHFSTVAWTLVPLCRRPVVALASVRHAKISRLVVAWVALCADHRPVTWAIARFCGASMVADTHIKLTHGSPDIARESVSRITLLADMLVVAWTS